MTTSCWKFRTFCFNLNRTCDRRAHAGDLQNDPPIKTFPWFSFLSTHNKKLTIHRRTWFFYFTLFLFPLSFCIKAWQVPGWKAFSGPTYVNPSGPTHFSFHCSFLWHCVQGAVRYAKGNEFFLCRRNIDFEQFVTCRTYWLCWEC